MLGTWPMVVDYFGFLRSGIAGRHRQYAGNKVILSLILSTISDQH